MFDVLLDDANGSPSAGRREIAGAPQNAFPEFVGKIRSFLAEHSTRNTFQAVDKGRDGHLGWIFDQQVNMVPLSVHLNQGGLKISTDLGEVGSQAVDGFLVEHILPIFGHKYQVDVHRINAMSSVSNFLTFFHRPSIV